MKTFFALSSKIIFFSAALKNSKPSIMCRVSSSHFPVFGSFTVPTPGRSVPNVHEALRELHEVVRPGDAVLVKASRAMGLEAIAQALTKVPIA